MTCADWKARERELRRRQLALPDRAMFAFGSLISGNRMARSAIFFYALLLHLAIFMVLARCASVKGRVVRGEEAGEGGLTEGMCDNVEHQHLILCTGQHCACGFMLRR